MDLGIENIKYDMTSRSCNIQDIKQKQKRKQPNNKYTHDASKVNGMGDKRGGTAFNKKTTAKKMTKKKLLSAHLYICCVMFKNIVIRYISHAVRACVRACGWIWIGAYKNTLQAEMFVARFPLLCSSYSLTYGFFLVIHTLYKYDMKNIYLTWMCARLRFRTHNFFYMLPLQFVLVEASLQRAPQIQFYAIKKEKSMKQCAAFEKGKQKERKKRYSLISFVVYLLLWAVQKKEEWRRSERLNGR